MSDQQSFQVGVDDFAARVKANYPEYSDLDNHFLASSVANKYPEYRNVIAWGSNRPTFDDEGAHTFGSAIPQPPAWANPFQTPSVAQPTKPGLMPAQPPAWANPFQTLRTAQPTPA
jgi:hypothetical protein